MTRKGMWHIPALAFVLGGVTALQEGWSFYLILLTLCVWAYLFRYQFFPLLTIFIFFISGWLYLSPPSLSTFSSSPISFKGVITTEVEETPHTIQMTLGIDDNEKMLLLFFKSGEGSEAVPASWKHGAVCVGEGMKEPIEEAMNPGQFDYRLYMAREGVTSQMTLQRTEDLQCKGRSWTSYAYEWRHNLMERVKGNVHPEAFGWMAALIFGETDGIDEATIDWFRDFNLSHILAISGLHVGLTVGGLYFAIFRTGLGTHRQASILILVLLPVYGFLAGGAPSVIRACLMAFILLLFNLFQRKIPLTDLISFAAVTLLVFSPSYFHHIGFQFSFLVTFSLILSVPILRQYESMWMQSAVISLISQLSILSFQIHYFYESNPFSLIANLIFIPYFSFFAIPVVMLLFLLCLIAPKISIPLSLILSKGHEGLLSTFQSLSTPIDLKWVIGEISPVYIVIYQAMVILMMKFWGEQKFSPAFLAGGLAIVVLMVYSASPYFSSKGTITMLDVGQGDAFVIELPYRRGVLMIDAAGPPVFIKNKEKTAEQVIFPYLKSRGIDRLDAIVVSHKDSDHSGSVAMIGQKMTVDRLIVSRYYQMGPEDIEVSRVQAGDRISISGFHFDVLHPKEDKGEPNDNSLVLGSEIGGKRWLFTGDISTAVEEEVLTQFPALSTDVLKVAHHGSHTSTSEAWVDSLQPAIALISVGKDNRYGHPHQEVVKRLEERQILLLQTDQHGAVQYNFSGQSGTFSTFLPYNASRE